MATINVGSTLVPVPEDLVPNIRVFRGAAVPEITSRDLELGELALKQARADGDGRTVSGIHFWRKSLGIPTNPVEDKDLMQLSLGTPILDGICEFVDRHYRMRGLGFETTITEEQIGHIDGLLAESTVVRDIPQLQGPLEVPGIPAEEPGGDGWTIAHLRFALPRLGIRLEIDDQTRQTQTNLMFRALEEFRELGDGAMVGWMHLRMQGIGITTDHLGDKDLVLHCLEAARQDVDAKAAGTAVMGMHYIIQQLYGRPSEGGLRPDLPAPKTI